MYKRQLNWNTPPIGETRTSPAPPPSYTLEEIAEGTEIGKGKMCIRDSLSDDASEKGPEKPVERDIFPR